MKPTTSWPLLCFSQSESLRSRTAGGHLYDLANATPRLGRILQGDELRFPLPIKNYNDLRADKGLPSNHGIGYEQEHPPGREAQVDFTHCGELGVTICGEPFGHLLFHFVLSHSGWRYVDIAYGETFAALVKGMQGALWELGGVPEVYGPTTCRQPRTS